MSAFILMIGMEVLFHFFFFQAEDGIRDWRDWSSDVCSSDLTMAKRTHSSIGDVLNQLRDEFSDITISKIRFLESQGLVDPERTPSGYRKFYPADVERLRFILREQREHFLPLKVIKERLDEVDREGGFASAGA